MKQENFTTVSPERMVGTAGAPLREWETPAIEDADIHALTAGSGTSGQEPPSFLKAGS